MKVFVVSIIAIVLLLVSAFILFNKPQALKTSVKAPPNPTSQKQEADIRASFTIITGNTIRSFKAKKYHNQSTDVYIENLDPTVIYVKRIGVTWDDFFKTLPMTLTKDCLITGDGETFCNGKNGTLKFYLNDIETLNLLDEEIRNGDKTFIKFLLF